jgi:protein arginine N-methyltransferase 1
MYDLAGYGQMIADRIRTDAYARALRQVVRPDSVVLDLGAGTGIMSLIACQCGARLVYAVDTSEALTLAREAAIANGFADRIVPLQESSTRIDLPHRADVIVADVRGILPPLKRNLVDLIDARERLRAPGGRLTPRRDDLWAALIEAPQLHRERLDPWDNRPFDLDLRSALPFVANSWCKLRAKPEKLLTTPQRWATLDYETLTSPHLEGEVQGQVCRDATAHGLAVWFDAELAEGIGFSNAPGEPPCIYGQAFFPWPEPVPVREGDLVEVSLRARLVQDEYVWVWESTVRGREAPEQVRCRFRQSTFHAAPLSKDRLAKLASNHVPRLNDDGQVALFALERMRGQASLGELAGELSDRFPARFPEWRGALAFLGSLSRSYSQ